MSMFERVKDEAIQVVSNEERTDRAIEAVGDAIDERTGGQHAEKIDQAQQAADDRLGDGGPGS